MLAEGGSAGDHGSLYPSLLLVYPGKQLELEFFKKEKLIGDRSKRRKMSVRRCEKEKTKHMDIESIIDRRFLKINCNR
jgi:hypothetical protein